MGARNFRFPAPLAGPMEYTARSFESVGGIACIECRTAAHIVGGFAGSEAGRCRVWQPTFRRSLSRHAVPSEPEIGACRVRGFPRRQRAISRINDPTGPVLWPGRCDAELGCGCTIQLVPAEVRAILWGA